MRAANIWRRSCAPCTCTPDGMMGLRSDEDKQQDEPGETGDRGLLQDRNRNPSERLEDGSGARGLPFRQPIATIDLPGISVRRPLSLFTRHTRYCHLLWCWCGDFCPQWCFISSQVHTHTFVVLLNVILLHLLPRRKRASAGGGRAVCFALMATGCAPSPTCFR